MKKVVRCRRVADSNANSPELADHINGPHQWRFHDIGFDGMEPQDWERFDVQDGLPVPAGVFDFGNPMYDPRHDAFARLPHVLQANLGAAQGPGPAPLPPHLPQGGAPLGRPFNLPDRAARLQILLDQPPPAPPNVFRREAAAQAAVPHAVQPPRLGPLRAKLNPDSVNRLRDAVRDRQGAGNLPPGAPKQPPVQPQNHQQGRYQVKAAGPEGAARPAQQQRDAEMQDRIKMHERARKQIVTIRQLALAEASKKGLADLARRAAESEGAGRPAQQQRDVEMQDRLQMHERARKQNFTIRQLALSEASKKGLADLAKRAAEPLQQAAPRAPNAQEVEHDAAQRAQAATRVSNWILENRRRTEAARVAAANGGASPVARVAAAIAKNVQPPRPGNAVAPAPRQHARLRFGAPAAQAPPAAVVKNVQPPRLFRAAAAPPPQPAKPAFGIPGRPQVNRPIQAGAPQQAYPFGIRVNPLARQRLAHHLAGRPAAFADHGAGGGRFGGPAGL